MITRLTLFTILMLLTLTGFSQKEMHQTAEAVEAAAVQELDELMSDPKFLEILEKQEVKGEYSYQITVKEKGQIASMRFLEKSDDADIKGQNFLNNLVKKHKFGFKVPKGNFYKFNYTFKISE